MEDHRRQKSPSECDFSHIFYARNSDPQLEVNVSDTKLYSPRENITEETKEISNVCNVETKLDVTRENITEKTKEIEILAKLKPVKEREITPPKKAMEQNGETLASLRLKQLNMPSQGIW